ncbi:MAG: transcriptional activator ligand binding domain protein [Verrucomicrobiaceae bacterium]|nr:transcriptional activator ligand binding domain protein [Verrucomicrobiaceae bacterium]
MLDQPQIVQTEAKPAAVIRLTIPRNKIQEVMGPAMGEVMAAVAAAGIKPAGPMFSHHFKMSPDIFDFEVGVPLASPITASGRVLPSELQAARVARTTYRGPYEGLGEAWGEFNDWLESEGLPLAPDLWECYVSGPESGPDSSTWATELNKPLAG